MPRKKQEPLVEEMEEEWDSQAEEDEWEEETEEEELEEVEEEQATEQPVAAPSAPAAPAVTDTTSAAPAKPPRRWDRVKGDAKKKSEVRGVAGGGGLRIAANEPLTTRELRNRIFPTLYAIFQQSRGQQQELKVKNRSLRSLTRSCLYHKNEDQLQRTLEDAEALFHKYCALTLKD
ncbi:splicing factor [Human mastadenovirus D]|uniref:Splicing factor n=1 Tax=Human mastadenovirus D TaxID=130310 RepID=T1UJ62_9ADEN|nr:splicing factor [Human mastadenovirus D]